MFILTLNRHPSVFQIRLSPHTQAWAGGILSNYISRGAPTPSHGKNPWKNPLRKKNPLLWGKTKMLTILLQITHITKAQSIEFQQPGSTISSSADHQLRINPVWSHEKYIYTTICMPQSARIRRLHWLCNILHTSLCMPPHGTLFNQSPCCRTFRRELISHLI